MSRYIDRGTFEELLVVNPAEAERALDVIRPLLDEFRAVVPAADLYFIVSHDDRQTFVEVRNYGIYGKTDFDEWGGNGGRDKTKTAAPKKAISCSGSAGPSLRTVESK